MKKSLTNNAAFKLNANNHVSKSNLEGDHSSLLELQRIIANNFEDFNKKRIKFSNEVRLYESSIITFTNK